jgi:hypothetical protein
MKRNPSTGAGIKRPAKRMGKMKREKAVREVGDGRRKRAQKNNP